MNILKNAKLIICTALDVVMLLNCGSQSCYVKGGVGKNGERSSSALELESTQPEENLPLPSDFLTEPLLQHTRTRT